jgi:hypothetical protein
MTNLSPAAQAVLTALTQQEYGLDPADIPNESGRMACVAAAALRAAADQVAPLSTNRRQNDIRFGLLRIANELEDAQ